MLFWFLKILLFLPSLIVYPVIVKGRKNLPKKGRVIFAANHQTLNDAPIVVFKFARRFHFMGKEPLFRKKFWNWFFRSIGAYPIPSAIWQVCQVKTTITLLKNDKALCIFPEGARLKTSESNELKNGVAMFALRTNSPIVPAYFVKRTNAFSFNKLLVGKPFMLSDMEEFKDKKIDKELLTQASKVISKNMHKLKNDYNKKNKTNQSSE